MYFNYLRMKGSEDYEPDYDYEEECQECIVKENHLSEIGDAIRDIVPMIYGNDNLDIAKLDDCLGFICDIVKCQLPANLPKIRRQGSEIFEFTAGLVISQNS